MSTTLRQAPIRQTIHHLAARWRQAEVLLPAFPFLARGRPLAIDDLSRRTGTALGEIERAVRTGRCEQDSAGRLVELYGMTLSPTLHRIEIETKIVFSCCALWAHVIPKLVDNKVSIESIDPVERQVARLEVSPRGIESAEPTGAVATLAIATGAAIESDVSEAFCNQVRHFVSRGSAQRFAQENPRRQVVELDELQEAADQLYDEIWRAFQH